MISIVIAILSLGLCGGIFFFCCCLFKGRKSSGNVKRDESLAQLEEVLRTAQLTNSGFFQSLELVQKNLESLLARAEGAEQRMRNLMLQPGGERRDQYAAAALLLNQGQEPHRVAAMLNLPLPQVEIVQQLHHMANQDKKAPARKQRGAEKDSPHEYSLLTKVAARREKISQPILLVDILRKAANDGTLRSATQLPFSGTKA